MHRHRPWFLGTAALFTLAACAALPSLRGGQADGLRFVADRHGPRGTVILLNNCDASALTKDTKANAVAPDNADCIINGEEDRKQLEPIHVRGAAPAGPMALKLVNYDPADRASATRTARVFNAKGRAILGPKVPGAECDPNISDTYTLTDADCKQLGDGGLTLYAEGLRFAGTVRLQLWTGERKADELVLHVAPFLLTPHTQDPVRNMVVRMKSPDKRLAAETARYVRDFEKACAQARTLCPRAARLSVQVIDAADQWIEDEMQWGVTETPRCQMPVALHMHRGGELKTTVQRLIGPGVGYFKAFDYTATKNARGPAPDFGGNLEVTPPTEKFPFGRVYYGSGLGRWSQDDPDPPRQMNPGFPRFFKRQKRHPDEPSALQEPIDLATSWLDVGHVDEIVTFVPANNPRGFVLLWASPELALDLLNDLGPETRREPTYLDGRYLGDYGARHVDDLLNGEVRTDRASFLNMGVTIYNRKVAQKIRKNVALLKDALGLTPAEIKPVPVLFHNVAASKVGANWAALASTPGMVNLSSMGRVSLVPDPLIPAFKDHIIKTMKEIDQTPIFIDDWVIYHYRMGEVHCGSNMQRAGFSRKWWK